MAEFRIDRLRFNWIGPWSAGTVYRKDDVVQYGGKVFVALANHTASADFNDDLDNFVAGVATPKWEQMLDGYEWKGEWQPETFYKVHDITKYRGIIYTCIDSHTSQSTIALGLEFDQEKWKIFSKGPNYLVTWTANTYYKKNDLIKYGGILYSCTQDHQSNDAVNGLEQDIDKWAIYNRSDNWKNVWTVNTRYVKDDIVKYGGNIYRCIVGHTSNSDIREGIGTDLGLDSSVAKWELVAEGIEYKGAWSGSQWYKTNDIVTYGPNLYRARRGMSGTDTFDDTDDWDIWLPGLGYENVWSDNEVYQPGDVVTYGGYSYIALTINIGSNPSAFDVQQDGVGADWEIVTRGYNLRGEWDILVQYKPGDVVRKGGYLYEALLNILPVEQTEPGDPDNDTSASWRLITTAIAWKGEWRDSASEDSSFFQYYPGDVVMDESISYICKKQHYSNIIEARPKFDLQKNSPGSDYWTVYAGANETSVANNVLRYKGDLRTYSVRDDGSTAGPSRLAIGTSGNVLKVDEDSTLKWDNLGEINKVWYVAGQGEDIPENGRSQSTPFKTVKYALQYLQGNLLERTPATVFVATGAYKEILPMVIPKDVAVVGDELRSTTIMPADGYETSDMFYMHNGSGLRNCTLQGLNGTLGEPNDNLTRRPSAGAYVSLDPTAGDPSQDYAWIETKSPYVQNVTTFGTGCIGMKVDGDLHNGGNKSIVANDFTQILSDGIGYWANGEGKSELVSVFTYYCHIGYLSTDGGKVRALNGNNSYGEYGCVAEGYDINETPITGSVDNRSKQAQIALTYTNKDKIFGVAYTNAGEQYTSATLNITGNGTGFASTLDSDIRDGAITEIFVTEEDSTFIGGSNYTFLANKAQIGTTTTLTLSGADDQDDPNQYIGQRLFIYDGKGTGQYGRITGLNTTNKIVTVAKESNGEPGWEHVSGRPIETSLNDTTRYYIEPRVDIAPPPYTTGTVSLGSADTWTDCASGTYNSSPIYVATASEGTVVTSTDGEGWNPATSTNGKFVAIANGNIFVANDAGAGDYSTDGGSTWTNSGSFTYTGVVTDITGRPDNNTMLATLGGSGTTTDIARSSDGGQSWSNVTLPTSDFWTCTAYGNGTWVALAGTDSNRSNNYVYSTDDGSNWTAGTLPATSAWSHVTFAKVRFVAITNKTDSSVAETAVSYDGITWYQGSMEPGEWSGIAWNSGTFLCPKSDTGASSDVIAVSRDGFHWTSKLVDSAFEKRGGVIATQNGVWVIPTATESNAVKINYGTPALARAAVASGRIGSFYIHETGSNYTDSPTVTVYDNTKTSDVTVNPRVGNGVLSQPAITNFGSNYFRSSATVSGDGYADLLQIADELIVTGISKLPGPGDNITIGGIDDVTYFVVKIKESSGGVGSYNLTLQISPNLGRAEAPAHGENIVIRQKYSQIRLTGHDFLDIGTGNFGSTNYPGLYVFGYDPDANAEPKQFQEVVQYDGGRVFYTSTDQDGNFRVGELFEVEQATGTISINAAFFELDGLEELRLGGVVLGGTGAVVREFSTDPTFAANSNNIVPTQKAIAAYVQSRVSSGGSDLKVNRLNAGNISFEGDKIFKVLGGSISTLVPVNFKQGVDGEIAAQAYFRFGGVGAVGGNFVEE